MLHSNFLLFSSASSKICYQSFIYLSLFALLLRILLLFLFNVYLAILCFFFCQFFFLNISLYFFFWRVHIILVGFSLVIKKYRIGHINIHFFTDRSHKVCDDCNRQWIQHNTNPSHRTNCYDYFQWIQQFLTFYHIS